MLGHLTYLALELSWGVPVLALQWWAGRHILREHKGTLLLALIISTAYLVTADGVAIAHGIWVLHANRIVGFYLADVPVEEAIFFFLTNAMVVQSVLLVRGWRETSSRAYHEGEQLRREQSSGV